MRFLNALFSAVSAAGTSQLLTRSLTPFTTNPLSLSVTDFQNPAFTIKYYNGPRSENTDVGPNPLLLISGTPSSVSHGLSDFTISSTPVNKEYLWDLSGFFEVPHVCSEVQSPEVVFRVTGAREAYLQFGYRQGYPHLKMDELEEMLEPQLHHVRDTEVRFPVQKGMFYPIRIAIVAGENTVRIWRKFGRREELLMEVYPKTSSRNMDQPLNEFIPTRDFLFASDSDRSKFNYKAYPAPGPDERDTISRMLYGELSQKESFAGLVEPAFSGWGVRSRNVPGALEITGFFRVPETGCYTFSLSGSPLSVLHIGVGNTQRSNAFEMNEGWRVLDMRVSAKDAFHLQSGFYYPFRIAVLGHEVNDPWKISQWNPNGNSVDVLGLSGNPAVPYSEENGGMNEWDSPGRSAGIETYAHCEIYDEWSSWQNEQYTSNMDANRDDRFRQYPDNPQTETEVVRHEMPAPEVPERYTEAPGRHAAPPNTPDTNDDYHSGDFRNVNEMYGPDTPEVNPSVPRYPDHRADSSVEMGNDPHTSPETNHFDKEHLHDIEENSQRSKHVLHEKNNPDDEFFERKTVHTPPPDVSFSSGHEGFPPDDKDIDQGTKKDDGLPEYSLKLTENYMENNVAKYLNREKPDPQEEEDMSGWMSDQPTKEQLDDDTTRDEENEPNNVPVTANSTAQEFQRSEIFKEDESKLSKLPDPVKKVPHPPKSGHEKHPNASDPTVTTLAPSAAIIVPPKMGSPDAPKDQVKPDAKESSSQLKSHEPAISPADIEGKDPKDNSPSILSGTIRNRKSVSPLKTHSELPEIPVNSTEPTQKAKAELISQQNVTEAIHSVVEEVPSSIPSDDETSKENKAQRLERVGVPVPVPFESKTAEYQHRENTSAVIDESAAGKNVSQIMVAAVSPQNDPDDGGPEISMLGLNGSPPDATVYPSDSNSTFGDKENAAKHVTDARNQVNPIVEPVFSGSPSPLNSTVSNYTSELDSVFSAIQVTPENRQISLSNEPKTRNSSEPAITESHQSLNRILENAEPSNPEVKEYQNSSQEVKSDLKPSISSSNVTEVYSDPKDYTSVTLLDGINGTNPVKVSQNPEENRGSNSTSLAYLDTKLFDEEAHRVTDSLDFANAVAVPSNADPEVGSNHTESLGLPNENLHVYKSSRLDANYNNSIVNATLDSFDTGAIVRLKDLSAVDTKPFSVNKDDHVSSVADRNNHSQVLSEGPVNKTRIADFILSDSNSVLRKTVASLPKPKSYNRKTKVSKIGSPTNREIKYARIPANCTKNQISAGFGSRSYCYANPHILEHKSKSEVFIKPDVTSDSGMHSDTSKAWVDDLEIDTPQRTRHYRAISDTNPTKDKSGPIQHSMVRGALLGSPLPDFEQFLEGKNSVSTSEKIPDSTVHVSTNIGAGPCPSANLDCSAHSNLAVPSNLESSPVNTSKMPSREKSSDSGFEGNHLNPPEASKTPTLIRAESTVNASYIGGSTEIRPKNWDVDVSRSNSEESPPLQEELFSMNEVNGAANIEDDHMEMNYVKSVSHSRSDHTQLELHRPKTKSHEKAWETSWLAKGEADHVTSMISWNSDDSFKEKDTLEAGRSVTPFIDAAPLRYVGKSQGRLALLLICVGLTL